MKDSIELVVLTDVSLGGTRGRILDGKTISHAEVIKWKCSDNILVIWNVGIEKHCSIFICQDERV